MKRPAPDPAGRRDAEREYRPDPALPNGPLVLGARVRDSLRTMRQTGHISAQQWDAAERFRDDIEMANGADPDRGDNAGVRAPWSGGSWPSEATMDALARVRAGWADLGPGLTPIAAWVVLAGRTLDHFAEHHRLRRSACGTLLQQALDVLVRRYRP